MKSKIFYYKNFQSLYRSLLNNYPVPLHHLYPKRDRYPEELSIPPAFSLIPFLLVAYFIFLLSLYRILFLIFSTSCTSSPRLSAISMLVFPACHSISTNPHSSSSDSLLYHLSSLSLISINSQAYMLFSYCPSRMPL